MKVKVDSLRKWMQKGAYDTAAAKDAINRLEQFMVGEGQLFEHAWKDVEPKTALRIQVEIVFLIDACMKKEIYDTTAIAKLMEDMTDRAMSKGKAKAKEAYEEQVAQSLKNGAGAAHKRTAIDHALPPLRLTFKEVSKQGEVQYVTDPIKVASKHTGNWCGTWGAYDETFDANVVKYFVALRAKHLDAAEKMPTRSTHVPAKFG